jgi:hypothetical protein
MEEELPWMKEKSPPFTPASSPLGLAVEVLKGEPALPAR